MTESDTAVPPLEFSHPDFSISAYPCMAGNLIVCPIKIIRTGADWKMSGWTTTGICKIPKGYRPASGIDVNILGVDNTTASSPVTGFSISSGEIFFRAFRAITFSKGAWVSAILAWRIEQ